MDGRFEAAAAAIFVAMVLDGADGRIARLTNTQSAFGAEYDSLSDVICFGLAPGIIVYEWALSGIGQARLAGRVSSLPRRPRCGSPGSNTQIGTADKRYFQGLPCPPAGATVAGLVWFASDYGVRGEELALAAFAMTIAIAGLMVSNVRFHSFKDLDLRGRVPFMTILVVVVLFVFVSSDPPLVLFLGMLGYVGSGPVLTLWGIRKRRAARRAAAAAVASDPPRDVGKG